MQEIHMNHDQKGFTLIELMIVVAIIGILAAVAIPQYQNYIARAQASESVSLLGAAKTPITEFVASNGDFPTTAELEQLGITDDNAGAVAKADTVASITVVNDAVDANGVVTGELTATLAAADINAALQGNAIVLAYNSATGSWVCGTDVAVADYQLLPQDCRRTIADAVTAAAPAAAP